jgi:hypothetical protein
VLNAAAATDWQVTPHDWRPDLYPHPDDGMPKAGGDGRLQAATVAG